MAAAVVVGHQHLHHKLVQIASRAKLHDDADTKPCHLAMAGREVDQSKSRFVDLGAGQGALDTESLKEHVIVSIEGNSIQPPSGIHDSYMELGLMVYPESVSGVLQKDILILDDADMSEFREHLGLFER